MAILEAAVCAAVELYCVILTVSIILSILFNGRLNTRNTSLHNAIQFNSTTKCKISIKLNQHLTKTLVALVLARCIIN